MAVLIDIGSCPPLSALSTQSLDGVTSSSGWLNFAYFVWFTFVCFTNLFEANSCPCAHLIDRQREQSWSCYFGVWPYSFWGIRFQRIPGGRNGSCPTMVHYWPCPFAHCTPLPSSNGLVTPLDNHEMGELSNHLRSSHAKKSNLCRGCLQSEGPRKFVLIGT